MQTRIALIHNRHWLLNLNLSVNVREKSRNVGHSFLFAWKKGLCYFYYTVVCKIATFGNDNIASSPCVEIILFTRVTEPAPKKKKEVRTRCSATLADKQLHATPTATSLNITGCTYYHIPTDRPCALYCKCSAGRRPAWRTFIKRADWILPYLSCYAMPQQSCIRACFPG